MGMREKAVRGVAWSTIEMMGGQLIALAVFVLLARLLDPSAFGLIAISGAFVAVMELFLSLGFSAAVIQRKDLEPEHLDTAFWVYLGLGSTLALVGFSIAGLVAGIYEQPELKGVIRWLSLLFLLHAGANLQEAILRRKLAFGSLAARTLAARVAGGVAGVVMAFQGFGVWSLVGQQLVGEFVKILVLWTVSDWRPGLKVTRKHFKDLFGFSVSLMGSHMLTVMAQRLDDFLIGYFLGPVVLGYYTVAYRLVRMGTRLLGGTVQKVAFPVFSRMQDDKERLSRAFYAATRLTMLIALPGFLALIVLAPEIVPTLFGEKWASSIPVMQILALMGVMRAMVGFNVAILVSQGRPGWKLIIQALETGALVIGIVIAVPWGIVSVAVAEVIAVALLTPVWFRASQRLSGIEVGLFLRNLFVPFGGSLIMLLVIYAVKEVMHGALPPLPQLLVYCAAGMAGYAIAVRLLAPGLVSEASELFGSLRKKRSNKAAKGQATVPRDSG